MEVIKYEIPVKFFDLSDNGIVEKGETKAVQLELPTNNPIVILGQNLSISDLENYLGECEYKFRKGVGYKGEIFRLKFKTIEGDKVIFG